jgi:hypothetical protein
MAIIHASSAPTTTADLSALPANILERLQCNGVHSLQDWRDLGPGRYRLWGITKSMVAAIDALAAEC